MHNLDTERAHVDFNAQFNLLRAMWAQIEQVAAEQPAHSELRKLVVNVREQAKTFKETTDETFKLVK